MFYSDHKGHLGASLGIGVTTYNRLDCLKQCIDGIRNNTETPFDLIIADDGSRDGTLDWCAKEGFPVIGGINRGIAWNKNRALYTLMQHSTAGVIILIEDDVVPSTPGWCDVWVKATERWGHINALHPSTSGLLARGEKPSEIIGGTGTPEDPYICGKISGMCISSTRSALGRVGFLDSRFKGYGHEHSEWTTRFHRFGYGVSRQVIDGVRYNYNLMLGHGLTPLDVDTSSDKSHVHENRKLMSQLKGEQAYRLPWSTPHEEAILKREVSCGLGIDVRLT